MRAERVNDDLVVKFQIVTKKKVGNVKTLRKRLEEVRKRLEEVEDEVIITDGYTSDFIYSVEAHTRTEDCWFDAVVVAAYHDGGEQGVYVMSWWDSSAQGPFISFYVLPCDRYDLREYSLAEAAALWQILNLLEE